LVTGLNQLINFLDQLVAHTLGSSKAPVKGD